jgi:Mg2+ and Co2+ transporter CorA
MTNGEHRIVAAVADPRVVDVATSWNSSLNDKMRTMLDTGDRATFNRNMRYATMVPGLRRRLTFRGRPYQYADWFDLFTAVRQYRLEYRSQAVVRAGPAGHLKEPERFLDELFAARHGFMAARTQAAMSREVFARMYKIKAFGRGRGQKRIDDAVDQFDHLCAMADGEKENLQGTIEFYQARTNTKVTIAAERLAVIAAITLPVTAVSSILGMNVIVNDATQPVELAIAVLAMVVMSALLLVWAKRRGWW